MKPLYTQEEFETTKGINKLPCECYQCGDTFYRQRKEIKQELTYKRGRIKYCSTECNPQIQSTKQPINCTNCDSEIYRTPRQIKKSNNHFCNKSCSATYNNKHKTHGTRRSKLEKWLEEQLTQLYPDLDIHFNRKDTIGSELDIYIPSLNLAIEINGIFHYKPIYGKDKLSKIQENDISKSNLCRDNNISLCVIDTSAQKYVKPKTSQKYLDVIINLLVTSRCATTTTCK